MIVATSSSLYSHVIHGNLSLIRVPWQCFATRTTTVRVATAAVSVNCRRCRPLRRLSHRRRHLHDTAPLCGVNTRCVSLVYLCWQHWKRAWLRSTSGGGHCEIAVDRRTQRRGRASGARCATDRRSGTTRAWRQSGLLFSAIFCAGNKVAAAAVTCDCLVVFTNCALPVGGARTTAAGEGGVLYFVCLITSITMR